MMEINNYNSEQLYLEKGGGNKNLLSLKRFILQFKLSLGISFKQPLNLPQWQGYFKV